MGLERPLGGRVALVTGGVSGIGRGCALMLARAGADVAIGSLLDPGPGSGANLPRHGADAPDDARWTSNAHTHLPSIAELDDTLRALVATGRRSQGFDLDVRSIASIAATVAAIESDLGPVDILVNAAGVSGTEPMTAHRDTTWDLILDVDLSGPFRTIRRVLPGMIGRRWGRIVNIASTAANIGAPGRAAYCAAKAGLLGLTRCVALEGAAHGVTCNAINPGEVDTPSNRVSQRMRAVATGSGESFEESRRIWVAENPQGRMIEAVEIGALAAYLCRDEAFGVTGQDIDVTGGTLW
ncbi:MAG: SDR family oxidoreductase [Alphaproteobacteria bacterium]|nr:SDR family oxidoreductase [Alphaproteobacteria bacterium]